MENRLERAAAAHRSPLLRRRACSTRALTHRSFGADHNERLEFLGDAVLNLVDLEPAVRALRRLRRRRPDPRARPPRARGQPAPAWPSQLGLPDVLRLGEGEARGGGAQRASILADALEALIGAVFLDGGFEAARGASSSACSARSSRRPISPAGARTRRPSCRNGCRRDACRCPVYRISAHRAGRRTRRRSRSNAACRRSTSTESGEGRSRRAAEQEAARRMLDCVEGERQARKPAAVLGRRPRWAISPDSGAATSPRRPAAASSPSSAGRTSASRPCSTRWSARRSASPRARRRPRGTASPASAPTARRSSSSSTRRASRRATRRR